MPAKNTNVSVATRKRNVKPRVTKPAPFSVGLNTSTDKPVMIGSAIIVPTAHDILLYAPGLYMPTPADIDQYGRADHEAYTRGDMLANPHHYADNSDAAYIADDIAAAASGHYADTSIALITPQQPDAANEQAATSTVPDLTERANARKAAALAVREFYRGESLPFKAAADLRYRAAINFARFRPGSVAGTERTAAALAAIIAYCNVQSDGTFIRGSGSVPRKMLGLTDQPDAMLACGLESGVLSRLIGTGAVDYISGETHGVGAELATYRVNYNKTRANMLAHNSKTSSGEHAFSRPLALLDTIVTERA